MNFAMHFFKFIALFLLIGSLRATFAELISHPLAGSACDSAICGQGTCKVSNTLIGYECECYQGWKQYQIIVLNITLPPCIIPDCTFNANCGAGSPSSPPPTQPLPPPPPPLFNPCTNTWCGDDGTCIANGTGVICKCDANSANLLDKPGLPCFKECSFGANCKGLGLGPPKSDAPPSPSSNASPPPKPTGSNVNGSMAVGIRFALTLLPLSALFLSWL